MAFVVSEGEVRNLDRPNLPVSHWLRLAEDYTADYAEIWRTQPAVRTVVSFLARNIASLGLHVFERVSDTDRARLTDHPLAQLLATPNPATTRYRLLNALMHDVGIYDQAYWLKLTASNGKPALVRLPPDRTRPYGDNWMWPDQFEVQGRRGRRFFPASQVVYFRGYNPDDQTVGCSPIESLRRILAEEYAAGVMREQVLRNGARVSGYLERPAEAPKWSRDGRERFRAEWRDQYVGNGPNAGGTPILEDGMTFRPAAQTAEELQYISARKLTREEAASAYFIPPPMVGILDNATFSNISEQHKMLYQDCLGPSIEEIQAEIGLQLVPEFADPAKVYVEFNLAQKLSGSFEDQAQALQASVGAPWLTRNEARARMNLPALDDGDELVAPLNVLMGGQASPQDSAPDIPGDGYGASSYPTLVKARGDEGDENKVAGLMSRFFARQSRTITSRLGGKSHKAEDWWDQQRWDSELADDLRPAALSVSAKVAAATLAGLGLNPDSYSVESTLAFLAAMIERIAGGINAATQARLATALESEDPAAGITAVFENAEGPRAAQIAVTLITVLSGFASVEAARQVGGNTTVKTWLTGSNPRKSHAAMNGQTVPVNEAFSNGAMWPGDASLPADEIAGCNCNVQVAIG